MTTIPPTPGVTPDAVQAWADWLKSAAPIFAPVATLVGGWLVGRKERLAKIKEMEDKHKKEADADTAAVIAAVTQRFQALIDGYEERIKDLKDEVHSLRDEVRNLRIALDQRPRSDAETKQLKDQIAELQQKLKQYETA